MIEVRVGPKRQEVRLYLTLDDVAEMVGRPAENLRISHVDTAPDDGTASVRICVIEETP